MIRLTKKLALAGALGALFAANAALAQDREPPADLVKAAQAEGALMFYSSNAVEQSEALLEAFEEKYGIKGGYVRFPTIPLMQRFATELEGKDVQADLVSVSSPLPYDQQPDWFADLIESEIPNLGKWPDEWVQDKRLTWTNSIVAITFNTDQIKDGEQPTKWTDLADPKWKGQILLTDPTVADNYLGWLDAMERAHGVDYLKAMSGQNYTLTKSGASGAQMVAAGANAINAPTFASFSESLVKDKGAPIKVQFMAEPTVVSPRDIGIAAQAPHPNAARLFVHWLLSEEGIRLICSLNTISVVADPDGKLGCVPTSNAESMQFEISDERKEMLAKALGVIQ